MQALEKDQTLGSGSLAQLTNEDGHPLSIGAFGEGRA